MNYTQLRFFLLLVFFAVVFSAPATKKQLKKLPANWRKGYQAAHATSTATTSSTTTTERVETTVAPKFDNNDLDATTTEGVPRTTISKSLDDPTEPPTTQFVSVSSTSSTERVRISVVDSPVFSQGAKKVRFSVPTTVEPMVTTEKVKDKNINNIEESTSVVTMTDKTSSLDDGLEVTTMDNVLTALKEPDNVNSQTFNADKNPLKEAKVSIPAKKENNEKQLTSSLVEAKKTVQKRHAQLPGNFGGGFGGFNLGNFGFGVDRQGQQGQGQGAATGQNFLGGLAGSLGQISNQALGLANNAASQFGGGFGAPTNQFPPNQGAQRPGAGHNQHGGGGDHHHGGSGGNPGGGADHHHGGSGGHHHGGGGNHHHGGGGDHHHGGGGNNHQHRPDHHNRPDHHHGHGGNDGGFNRPQRPHGNSNFGGSFPGGFGGNTQYNENNGNGGDSRPGGPHGGVSKPGGSQGGGSRPGGSHGGSIHGDSQGVIKPKPPPPKRKGDILFPTIPFTPIRPGSAITDYIENRFPVILLNDNEIR